jgi:hypothetical protein
MAAHPYAIRFLGNHLSFQNALTPSGIAYQLLNLPYYHSSRIYDYAGWFIREHQESP